MDRHTLTVCSWLRQTFTFRGDGNEASSQTLQVVGATEERPHGMCAVLNQPGGGPESTEAPEASSVPKLVLKALLLGSQLLQLSRGRRKTSGQAKAQHQWRDEGPTPKSIKTSSGGVQEGVP